MIPQAHKNSYIRFLLVVLGSVVLLMQAESTVAVPNGGMSLYELSARPWLYNLTQKYQQPISKYCTVCPP